MSAKSTLPQYVMVALNNERAAQINTMATVVVYLFGEAKAERETTEVGDKMHKASPHRSLKTWRNYVAVAQALAVTASVKLESLHAEHQEPAESVLAFAPWLQAELKRKGYTTGIDDMQRYAKGKPSIKAQEAAEKLEQQRMQAEAEAAEREAAKALPTHAEQQADETARVEAVAQAKEEQIIPEGTNESAPLPPAILPPQVAPLLIARRNGFNIDVEFGPDVTREELEAIISACTSLQGEMAPEAVAA